MFLVNNANYVVILSASRIDVADGVYQVDGINYLKSGLSLQTFELPLQYEVGWCTYHNGAFTTIPKPPVPVSEEVKQAIKVKKEEINAMCEQTITYGVDYTSTIGAGHYTLTKYDQINIKTWGDLAYTGKSVPYHADGEDCRMYAPTEFLGLVGTVTMHILYNQTYANQLRLQAAEMVELSDVQAVYYGMALNEERQAKLDAIIKQMSEELGLTKNETTA